MSANTSNPLINASTDQIIKTINQIIYEIQGLQALEKTLYTDLVNSISSNSGTPESINNLTQHINDTTSTRMGLYDSLNSMGEFFVNNLNDTTISLRNQIVALEIVENELNQAKQQLRHLEDEKVSKLRLIEIKRYYGKKYEEHTYIMTYIIGMFVWVFILSYLSNLGFLPKNVFTVLLILVIVFYIVMIIRTILRIMKRDKMNYDEYYYADQVKNPDFDPNFKASVFEMPSPICAGQACCSPNETYDETMNVCVPNAGTCLASLPTTQPSLSSTAAPVLPESSNPYNLGYFQSGQDNAAGYDQSFLM